MSDDLAKARHAIDVARAARNEAKEPPQRLKVYDPDTISRQSHMWREDYKAALKREGVDLSQGNADWNDAIAGRYHLRPKQVPGE